MLNICDKLDFDIVTFINYKISYTYLNVISLYYLYTALNLFHTVKFQMIVISY